MARSAKYVIADMTDCSIAHVTPYCPVCGERPPGARDLTLRGLFDQLVHEVTSVDGRRSVRAARWSV